MTSPARGTVLDREVPALRLSVADPTSALGRALSAAVEMLVDAGLLRRAREEERADVVHTVGDVRGVLPGDGARRVHTLERVVLRPNGQLAPARFWLQSQRPRATGCAALLTHGRMACRLVVESALAPGERVYCLPVLPASNLASVPSPDRRPARPRIGARRRLGVPPGVRVVVGTSSPPGWGVSGWAEALRRLHRRDLLVIEAQDVASSETEQVLLQAADLYVAAGRELTATSAAVNSLELGIPVIAVTSDSAAELVTPGRDGCVVAPRVDAIVDAVVSAVEGAWLPDRPARSTGVPFGPRDLARMLLGIYEATLASAAPTRRLVR